jgi:Flp pilus assembly protein TadD
VTRLTGPFLVLALVMRGACAQEEPAPADVRQLALQATSDLQAQRYDQAAAACRQMIERHPNSTYAWDRLGKIRYDEGNLGPAIDAFRQAVRLDAKDEFALVSLGLCFFDEHRFSAAIPPLERAENLRPDNSNVHALLAQCYARTGRDDEARRERQIENVEQIETYR